MSDSIMDIAHGVAELLVEYQAEVTLNPDFELSNTTIPRVIVIPVLKQLAIGTRQGNKVEHHINVGIIHKCRSPEAVEPLIQLSETIGSFLLRKQVGGEQCVSIEWQPLYAHEEIRSKGQFVSVITAIFKEID